MENLRKLKESFISHTRDYWEGQGEHRLVTEKAGPLSWLRSETRAFSRFGL